MIHDDTAGDGRAPVPAEADYEEARRFAAEQRYRMRPSRGAPHWALAQLNATLVAHAKLYTSEDLQDQRDAIAGSLFAVIDYLTGRGFAPATLEPLTRPITALVERENNAIDGLFAERARQGRPKASMAQHDKTGILAALANEFLRTRADDPRPQSAKLDEAARKMKGPWFDRVTRAKLETAREIVSQESAGHLAVRKAEAFSALIQATAEKFGDAHAFDVMVRMINDIGPILGAGKGISKTPTVSPTDNG